MTEIKTDTARMQSFYKNEREKSLCHAQFYVLLIDLLIFS